MIWSLIHRIEFKIALMNKLRQVEISKIIAEIDRCCVRTCMCVFAVMRFSANKNTDLC